MNTPLHTRINIQLLTPPYTLPWDLLLLADETEDAIHAYVHDCAVYVAIDAQQVVAVACVQALSVQQVELKNLAVAEAYQGQGVGSLMMSFLKRQYQNSHSSMLVGTADVGVAQQRFYQRHGFVRVGIRERFFIEHYPQPIVEHGQQLVDMYVFECRL